jgi:hypothetical protein
MMGILNIFLIVQSVTSSINITKFKETNYTQHFLLIVGLLIYYVQFFRIKMGSDGLLSEQNLSSV